MHDAPRDQIQHLRISIDAIDQKILQLIAARCVVSHQIQAIRLATGGGRVDLRRESEVIQTYDQELGQHGVQIALDLMSLARGPLRSASTALPPPV